jgi:hypothetical protein
MIYNKTELMKLKLPEIKIIASGKGISHSGVKKEDLVDRIVETGDADCVYPKTRNPKTNKCQINKAKVVDEVVVIPKKGPRQPCPEDETRDKDTKECRPKKNRGKAKVVD